jgi:hypothetical protein
MYCTKWAGERDLVPEDACLSNKVVLVCTGRKDKAIFIAVSKGRWSAPSSPPSCPHPGFEMSQLGLPRRRPDGTSEALGCEERLRGVVLGSRHGNRNAGEG